jgi:P2 family phage contractile tail tube protein
MESANLFCGDDDPTSSNHLVLQEIKLPGLEENYADHAPTGAPIAIEIDTHMIRLEATFNLAGWQTQVMTLIGESNKQRQKFTIYGLIRDRRTGEALESIALLEGRLGRVNPTNFRKGDLQSHEFSIRGITHYELTIEDEEIYAWDFFTSTRRIGGVDIDEDMRQILRISQF